jgi:hypothetical protein
MINYTDNQEIENFLVQISEQNKEVLWPQLVPILAQTENTEIRDKIALTIRDWKIKEAVPILFELIKKPSLHNQRGTLLYALQVFDCKEYIFELVGVIGTGNYEAREMALQILESWEKGSFSEIALDEAIAQLKKWNKKATAEQKQYIQSAINCLKELKKSLM